MIPLVEYLERELARRNWRPADLARAAGVPPATISHILNGSRRAGPEVCNALAQALGEPPERLFRRAGLLPTLPHPVEEEREAVRILRTLPPDLRTAAMRMLRSLIPGASLAPAEPEPPPGSSKTPISSPEHALDGSPSEDRPSGEDRDPYLAVLEQLWDKAPDWKKKDIAAQIRAAVEEYQGERGAGDRGEADDPD